MEKNPCENCSKCCEYVCLEIDEPTLKKKADVDEIKWYLLHKNVWVFIDHDDSWNIQFNSPCEKLDKDGNCSYYEKRPTICRKHGVENCEKYGEGDSFKVLFKTIEEFESWFEKGCEIPKDE